MILAGVLMLLALVLPELPLGQWRAFLLDTAQFAFIISGLALAWDLLARTGQLSLAHGAFFGLGAYAAALSAPALGTLPALLVGGRWQPSLACCWGWQPCACKAYTLPSLR